MSVPYELVVRFIREYARAIEENRDYLTQLDSPIGDADHGINMHRGMQAAIAKLDGLAAGDIGALLRTVGMTLVSTVGGAGGPLYGTLFMQMGMAASGKAELSPRDWLEALERGLQGVVNLGKAELGDKTMVDALTPARDALKEALDEGASFGDALRRAAAAAEEGMKATIPMVARKGRASYLGERSAGHQDPGATSSYLLIRAAADAWSDADP
ncbi:MAG TPA: dihydroxyacetone kinase subunit DhaL [Actinomycetota bacterium]|nr:dihydroxyacetone kinase subunit DhaL [Actinomycetota bacterium]